VKSIRTLSPGLPFDYFWFSAGGHIFLARFH
jgi:hypothetical protein